jgi:hypothetical protein
LFNLPEDTQGRYAMAASTKGDDYVRAKAFVPNVDKYKTIGDKKGRTIPAGVDATELNINVDPLTLPTGQPISASTVRLNLMKNDYAAFRKSYPNHDDAVVKNAWQILTGLQESIFSKNWWTTSLQEEINQVVEGYMDPKTNTKHKAKIKKLRKFLDSNIAKPFVYDFKHFEKTVYGVPLTEAINLIKEGGAAGHMAHPYDDHSLSFGDVKEIIARSLGGRLDIEAAVTEKTDGQNIQVTYKNNQIGFARNKGTVINPMSVQEIQDKFGGRGPISDAFGNAAEDLAEAFTRVNPQTLNGIFKNGRVFANMEIIYPATKNVISYDVAVLQFHNLVEYDEQGNIVETDLTGGGILQSIIQEANAHLQKTFSFIPPQRIKIGRLENFEDQQAAFFAEADQLKNRYGLKDTDLVSDYHKAWWADVIREKAQAVGYDIPDSVLSLLIARWAFFDKSTSIVAVKKQIDNADFANWVNEFDKKDFKTYYKQNMEPFESLFLRLGAVVLQNAQNFLAANPSKSAQELKRDLADLIRELQTTNDINSIKKLEHELRRIQRLGGFEAIVPSEGVVFVYGGNTYKLTGAFAPVNQILGVLKYAR